MDSPKELPSQDPDQTPDFIAEALPLAEEQADEPSLDAGYGTNDGFDQTEDDDDEGYDDSDDEEDDSEAEAQAAPLTKTVELPLEERLDLTGEVEAIIFAAPQPIKAVDILEVLQRDELAVRHIIEVAEHLRQFYQSKGGGFRLVYQQGKGYQFQTVAAASALMERMFSQRPRPLTRAAQETLAIIAYRQPVTRADLEFIRGVDAGSIIKNLMERDLIQCVGRKEDAGRPMLFGTTDEFLKVYRLHSLGDLPPLEAFQAPSDTMKNALDKIGAEQKLDLEAMIREKDQGEDAEKN